LVRSPSPTLTLNSTLTNRDLPSSLHPTLTKRELPLKKVRNPEKKVCNPDKEVHNPDIILTVRVRVRVRVRVISRVSSNCLTGDFRRF
jgi:hypothetical protein